MKTRIVLTVLSLLILPVLATAKNFNVKAVWTPNALAEGVHHYTLYRTDGGRAIVPACYSVLQPAAPLPATIECPFVLTITDGTEVNTSFVLTATDGGGNTSFDSDTANFFGDAKPPSKPGGTAWQVILQ